ncbi:hypothetical protein Mycch_0165 [Mycolicibacterium chubuense NBB4]|uniref:Protein-glutamine gamma-glutamyltransferase-like C-terminal domain-containing protein n=1 Tax=Mycolicibacterium chubuense (strain NBB4) TaxID=710421 RepID=I4BCI4_MYCCN|nr:DUF4129 domain-containing protein [Mycolicibacterium chubuense]AFM14991.1 hypothetical protein Mycch_0165 [Mycolicibacterium chubuense NBB4]
MAGDEKAVARTAAVIGLVLVAAVALRGYLPGAPPPREPRESATGGPGSLIAVLTMLALSIAVIAIAILTQVRRPSVAAAPGEPPPRFSGERGRPQWRLLLVAVLVLLAWIAVLALMMRWRAELVPGSVSATETPPGTGTPTGDQAPRSPSTGHGDTVFGYLAAAAAVLVAVSIAGSFAGRKRVTTTEPQFLVPAADPVRPRGPDLARAAERGLVEIGDRSRDPREAIIACYAAMETELEKSPGTIPRASDTPTEVLERAVERRVLPADSAFQLVELFEEARFSPHVMNEGHRDDAVRALRRVQGALQVAT